MKPKSKKTKEKYSFIFPNILAKAMKNVPMRTQLESSLISMSLIMLSLTLMVIYLLFFGEGTWVYRILLLINLLAGFLFISSFLLTTFQQYQSHMQMMGYDPQKERADVLKRGHLLKRIKLAFEERKKVKRKEKQERKRTEVLAKQMEKELEEGLNNQQTKKPNKKCPYSKSLSKNFVNESLDRMDEINEQTIKEFKESQGNQQDESKQNQKFISYNLKGGITK